MKIPESKWAVRPGDSYNSLTAISPPFWVKPNVGGVRQVATFQCVCGATRQASCRDVKSGRVKSCGPSCPKSHSVIIGDKKRCNACGEFLAISQFKSHRRTRDGLNTRCENCEADVAMRRRFGFGLEYYNTLLAEQDNKCAICRGLFLQKTRLCVDHCHTTNSLRGLLCHTCNRIIGLLQDNIKIVENATEYLRASGTNDIVPDAQDTTINTNASNNSACSSEMGHNAAGIAARSIVVDTVEVRNTVARTGIVPG